MTLLLSISAMAQSNFLMLADEAYNDHHFFQAVALYKKALTKEKKNDTKAYIFYKIADAYRHTGEAEQCEVWFKKAIDANYSEVKSYLYYADALKLQGKDKEALAAYKIYKEKNPSDPLADQGINSSSLSREWTEDATRWRVENLSALNTIEREFSPIYADDEYRTLYFTSTRQGATGSKEDATIGELYSDVFVATVDNNGIWSTPMPLDAPITTDENEGLTTITRKGDKLYWTRCIPENNKIVYNQLWVIPRQGENKWGKPTKLPFNNDTTKFASPAISPDGSILVFASNLTGGYGENDLWMVKYDASSDSWGVPTNLGPEINSPGNDVFPFISEHNNLYYSTNGKAGMGGLDIFKADSIGVGKWGKAENMQFPINSNKDDFGVVLESSEKRGYLSSNREGTKGRDDLWSFVLPDLLFSLDGGQIKDDKFNEGVPNVKVVLKGSDGSVVETYTDENGNYKFEDEYDGVRTVKAETSYTLSTSVGPDVKTYKSPDGFINSYATFRFSSVGLEESKQFKGEGLNMVLTPIEGEIKFPAVLYAFGKADLTPQAKDSLEFLYKILVNNPSIAIRLEAHTDYVGSDAANLKLSNDRARSCYEYLVSRGIPSDRLASKGFGERKPYKDGEIYLTEKRIRRLPTQEERDAANAKNRRTVFSITSRNYGVNK